MNNFSTPVIVRTKKELIGFTKFRSATGRQGPPCIQAFCCAKRIENTLDGSMDIEFMEDIGHKILNYPIEKQKKSLPEADLVLVENIGS
jgi:hypothetical protein